MIGRLKMELNANENEISYQMASTFHGALMELLPKDYATELHLSKRHPYTQHLERSGDKWYWIVTALNDEAVKHIIKDSLSGVEQIVIKKHDLVLNILNKEYDEMTKQELSHSFYQEQASKYADVQFVTPTAFKQNGRYVNYPDIRLIFMSIMNGFDAAYSDEEMFDEGTLDEIVNHTLISRYALKSATFNVEGVRISAFVGRMTLKLSGTQTMANFVNMLLSFAEFSGIGIKTALGMGAIRVYKRGR